MISIVCVYNNEITYKNVILKSLKNQSAKFEMIPLDNRNNKYKSAAEALNHGGMKTKGEYIMFVHQDVFLGYNDWLKDAFSLYDKLEQLIVPLFYHDRDRFVDVMRYCVALNGSFFNTHRMIQEYVLKAYFR